jgi:excisionase family DNA binding protein
MKLTIKLCVEKLDGTVGKSTLYNAVKARQLPHYRIRSGNGRGKIVIDEDDLLAWLEQQKVGAGEAPTAEPLKHIRRG